MASPRKTETDASREMLVTACYGRRFGLAVPVDLGAPEHQARTRGKRLRPVAGDRVLASPLVNEDDWLIESVLSRDNELARPDSRGRREVLAANVSLMIVVVAPEPAPDFYIVDRYLAAARLMPCEAAIVWSKSDLDDPPEACDTYAALNYPVLSCSARGGAGIDALASLLQGHTGILVGQSGVGKSSLINALIGDSRQRIGAVSEGSREGRHTTVTAALIRTEAGLAVIDSPGVRDYAPSIDSLRDVGAGFVEIAHYAQHCRFADCQHRAEPGCAVKAAVASGEIDARRYDSYRRLRQLTEQLRRDW
ncbi:MAG: ribosome small subunit-dependent GTPase A [Pseudomonadota bacterium]